MRAIDLFSGIGGFALAGKWVWGEDYEIVAFCEIDKFCQKVLRKNFGDVPIYEDIKTLNGKELTGIDLLTGGFPCQPYSVAGKRKGKEDDRALWPEMLRVIQEVKPRWVIGENVAGFVNMGLDESISDLENEGYEVQTFIIPACAVNAPHRRDRVWIVAHRKGTGAGSDKGGIRDFPIGENRGQTTDSHAPDTGNPGLQGSEETGNISIDRTESRNELTGRCSGWQEPWLEVATRLCRVDDGVSNRVDRLKSLGNAIVPQVVYEIMKAIKNIENQV